MKGMRRPLAAGVAAASLALAACGGGAPGQTRLAAGSPADDRAAAARTLLTGRDLGGYEAAPVPEPDAAAVDLQAASTFEACAGAAAALGDDRIAQSPAFFKGRTVMVSSLAVVAPTEAAAAQAMVDLGRADLGGCLTALFRSVLGLDFLPGTTATTDPLPGGTVKSADSATAWRTSLNVAISGQTVPAYSDLTFLRAGRAVGVLFAFEIGKPFDPAERTRLVDTVAARLDQV
ncbi:MAG: hypothetical protein ACLGI2_15675 [Acidimicrobiia bacterium]